MNGRDHQIVGKILILINELDSMKACETVKEALWDRKQDIWHRDNFREEDDIVMP